MHVFARQNVWRREGVRAVAHIVEQDVQCFERIH